MLNKLLRMFWWKRMDHAKINIDLQKSTYQRKDHLSGRIEIYPLAHFQLYKDPMSLSLRRKSLGKDKRLRDFFQDHHIELPKQTRQFPDTFQKWVPVYLDFSLKNKQQFNEHDLIAFIQKRKFHHDIARDQQSIQAYIESLETFSRQLQFVVLASIKTQTVTIDNHAITETIEWLKEEEGKLRKRSSVSLKCLTADTKS